jgi:DNA polymerase elongation subunit (family B)
MELTKDEIKDFLEGRDPQKHIVGIESSYDQNFVNLIINDPERGKVIEKHKFRPFVWMKTPDMTKFFKGDRRLIKNKMREYMITITPLHTEDSEGKVHPRLDSGFKFLVQTRGTYRSIINFFKESGFDMQKEENRKHFLSIGPTEQFLIQTGKRLFKGFEDYSDIVRFSFDIETTGLSPEDSSIFQIGMKDNRGFEHVLEMSNEDEERNAIQTFFLLIDELKPDIICGYNSENFDWHFILRRAEILGLDHQKIVRTLKKGMPLYRKQATLKMGAEMEYYEQTVMWGYNILDVWHAVRRAKAINSNIKETGLKYITKYSKVAKPNRVYIGHDKIAKIWNDHNPYLFNEVNGKYGLKENLINDSKEDVSSWQEVDGKFIVRRYLLDDLWETEQIDYKYNQATFLLSKLVPSTLQRTSTMGTAALWKILMCAWSYENGLAIPDYQPKQKFPGGLSRLLRIGFVPNVVKLDYGSLYPSIQLTHDVFPEVDITGALKGMLTYLFGERDLYKGLMKKAQKEGDVIKADMYDKKQLPIKILNNSNFGSVSAPDVYPWGDIDVGSMITCTGRQYLRLMIKFFMEKGFEPIVGDTDGFNFKIPDNVNELTYIGKGTHQSVVKDKKYIGIDACVAEYNEKFMRGFMKLGVDEIIESTINLSRKNYADLIDGDVKLVGNTIKSAKLPIYIEEFLDKGIRMLLEGNGKEFIEHYYDYVEIIFNQEIPLVKIASKSKVKQTLDNYIENTKKKNKAGNPMPRQAHMELILKEDIKVNLGDTIYYVNTGTKKSHADVKAKKLKDGSTEIEFNSSLISTQQIENNPDLTGEYNVSKYLSAFNTRIEPLLVCFSPEIRSKILIDNPSKRQYFTESQVELCSGFPTEPADQDTLDDVFVMEQKEIDFWDKVGVDPEYMYVSEEVNEIKQETNDIEYF